MMENILPANPEHTLHAPLRKSCPPPLPARAERCRWARRRPRQQREGLKSDRLQPRSRLFELGMGVMRFQNLTLLEIQPPMRGRSAVPECAMQRPRRMPPSAATAPQGRLGARRSKGSEALTKRP